MTLVRTAQGSEPIRGCSGSTASCTRTPPAHSDCRTSVRSTRCTSSGTGATSRRSSSRPCTTGSRGSDASPARVPGQPDVRRARRCGPSSRSKIWRTCPGSGCSAEIATRASTRTPTPIHGRGSCTTFTSSTAKMTRSGFSRHVPVARSGAFIVDAFDPRHEAVVEGHGADHGRDVATHCKTGGRMRAERPATARPSSTTPRDSVTLRVEAACPGLLVLPDTYFPGWRATVNGRDQHDLPDRRCVPRRRRAEGTSRVEFRYEPRAFPIGIALAVGRARCVPRRRVSPLVAYAEPTSRNAEP